VLDRYSQELDEMQHMYESDRANPPRPKNMPPDSGKIAWARSIITRIKTPIDKFKTKAEILTQNEAGRKAAQNYVKLAQSLTE
jgi:dynein heavy chain